MMMTCQFQNMHCKPPAFLYGPLYAGKLSLKLIVATGPAQTLVLLCSPILTPSYDNGY